MVSFGRFRIVPIVLRGKAVFEVRVSPGNILFGVFPSMGKAASEAIKLSRAERRVRKAVDLAKSLSIKFHTLVKGKTKKRRKRRKR